MPAQLDGDFRPQSYWPEEYPSREEVLRVDPDLVVSGFTGAFTREGLGTRAELGVTGTETFLFSAYCPAADGGGQQSIGANDVSFAGVERDLTDLGRLLGAEDRAAEVVAGMRSTLGDVAGRLAGVADRPRVAMLNSPGSTGELRVFGTGDVATTIIEAAGGQQAFDTIAGRQRTVSLEGIVAARPDVIVIPACCGRDVGPEGAEPLAERLRNDPALATVPRSATARCSPRPSPRSAPASATPTRSRRSPAGCTRTGSAAESGVVGRGPVGRRAASRGPIRRRSRPGAGPGGCGRTAAAPGATRRRSADPPGAVAERTARTVSGPRRPREPPCPDRC
ncbi:ABC transporter substrate-binding protein [Pseudonocardia sp. HH130629-09]|uniref:ABC transporter substrate-binding protein n=1 Tax=Pseudonocardia sp. HH130629-09 TaxID=1641402 RepID=UPI000761961F|nr:ABC transporter substrate-binding protein [Pseudonocardia sp. HH130629-09]